MPVVRELVTQLTFRLNTRSIKASEKAINGLKQTLESLANKTVNINVKAKGVKSAQKQIDGLNASISALNANLSTLGGMVASVKVKQSGLNSALKTANALSQAMASLNGRSVNISANNPFKGMSQSIRAAQRAASSPSGGARSSSGSQPTQFRGLPIGWGRTPFWQGFGMELAYRTGFNGFILGPGALAADAIITPISAVVRQVVTSIDAYREFEAQASRVQAIAGGDPAAGRALAAQARELGVGTPFTATEVAQGQGYFAMTGKTPDEIRIAMPDMLNLALANGYDLARTSDIVSDALEAFNMDVSETGRMADVFAATAMNANTTVNLMGDTFKYVGSVAGTMGYTIEDAALATGLMANMSVKGTRAGTALRRMMTNLVAPTSKNAALQLEKIGFSAVDSNGNLKSFRQQIIELRKALRGLSKDEQVTFAKDVIGMYGMTGFLAVINASEEAFQRLAEKIDNAAGASEEFARIATDNLEGDLKRLESISQEWELTVGKLFEPTERKLSQQATGFLTDLHTLFRMVNGPELPEGLTVHQFNRAQEEYDAFVEKNQDLIKQKPELFELAKSLKGIADAARKLGDALTETAPALEKYIPLVTGLATAVEALVTALTTLVNLVNSGLLGKATEGLRNDPIMNGVADWAGKTYGNGERGKNVTVNQENKVNVNSPREGAEFVSMAAFNAAQQLEAYPNL